MIKKKGILIASVFLLIGISMVIAYASFNSNVYDSGSTESTQNNKKIFSDVDESDWFYADVNYVNEHDLMKGTGENNFSPYEETTRGMIVTILWRLEGEPLEEGTLFEDVGTDAYYHAAIQWASNHQIVSGYSESIFGPDDSIIREQFAAMMYRYALYKGCDVSAQADLNKYTDADQISDYAIPAFEWANANGIITGTSESALTPQGEALRGQAAAMLKRFCTKFIFTETEGENPEESNIDAGQDDLEKGNSDEAIQNPSTQTGGLAGSPADNSVKPAEDDEQDNSPSIIVGSASANPGDDITIAVTLNNNPGILGMTLTAYYDETVCMLESVENGEAFKNILDFTASKTLGSGARFVWDGVEISGEDVNDGPVLLMNFRVLDTAEKGKFPITIEYADGDIIDNNLTSVYPQIETGYITIQ